MLFTFAVLGVMGLVIVNASYLNPIDKALKDFELTDLYYSNLKDDHKTVNDGIVLVNIGYNDRAAIARQLSILQSYQPKVIGLDALFLEPKDSITDEILAQSIRNSAKIVMAEKVEYDDKNGQARLSVSDARFVQNKPQGFINFLAEEDQTVRYVMPEMEIGGRTISAFSTQIVREYSTEAYQQLKKRRNETELINYQKTGFVKFDTDDLEKPGSADKIKDKIVILGFMGRSLGEKDLEDFHLTPLNKSFGGHAIPDMYGVEIHANIIAMMLSQNYVSEIPEFWNILAVVFLSFLAMVLFVYIKQRFSAWASNVIKLCQLVCFSVLVFLALISFHYLRLKIEPGFLLIAVVAGGELMDLYNELILWAHKKWGFNTYFQNTE